MGNAREALRVLMVSGDIDFRTAVERAEDVATIDGWISDLSSVIASYNRVRRKLIGARAARLANEARGA